MCRRPAALVSPYTGKPAWEKTTAVVVDAWFTGFAGKRRGRYIFLRALGRNDGMDVSSSLAKEIAIQIVLDYCAQ